MLVEKNKAVLMLTAKYAINRGLIYMIFLYIVVMLPFVVIFLDVLSLTTSLQPRKSLGLAVLLLGFISISALIKSESSMWWLWSIPLPAVLALFYSRWLQTLPRTIVGLGSIAVISFGIASSELLLGLSVRLQRLLHLPMYIATWIMPLLLIIYLWQYVKDSRVED